ncbi:hypothetical protein P692DRAFT_201874747 [Suillus brevipes Sb2]|nr:hypothetical protein P692DRAFT_201874747 [Suillus brevipes Sb2]
MANAQFNQLNFGCPPMAIRYVLWVSLPPADWRQVNNQQAPGPAQAAQGERPPVEERMIVIMARVMRMWEEGHTIARGNARHPPPNIPLQSRPANVAGRGETQ